jgi:diguanylate cyclase (GGDEF)-like protein
MLARDRIAASVHRFAGPAACVSVLVGSAALVGWMLDVQALKSVGPGEVAMKANTALGFVQAGVSLWLLRDEGGSRSRRVAGAGLGVVIAAFSALTLAEYVFGIDLGIDHIFRDSAHASYPGRPSPHTTVGFLCIGMWLAVLPRAGRVGSRVRNWLSVITCLVVLQAATGFLFGVQYLYGINGESGMAVQTMFTFLVLCAGILAARPSFGFTGLLASVGTGGQVARRLAPAVVLLPLLIGYVSLKAQQLGLIGTREGISIFAGLTLTLLSGIVVHVGLSLNRADAARHVLEERLKELSQRDPLTNLFNRRRFDQALEHELALSARHGDYPALIMCDLDGLKQINDSFGHPAGDKLLLGLAETLISELRTTDTIARLGGDEFAALLPGTGSEGADAAASKLVHAMRRHSWALDGQAIGSTLSAGVALADPTTLSAGTLSRAADQALYRAKAAGGDCYAIAAAQPQPVAG